MSTFLYNPDWSAKKQNKPRVNTAQFGDGYEQRVSDGLNTNLATWNISFVRDPETIEYINSFLYAKGGVYSFNWTAPNGYVGVYKCSEWDSSYDSPGWSTLTATFTEVAEPLSAISGDSITQITASGPSARSLCRAASYGKYIYIIGGFVSSGTNHKELWRYDTIANVWTQLANAIDNVTPASGTQVYAPAGNAFVHNGKIYVPGQHYDIKTNTWSNTDPAMFGSGCPWWGNGNYVYSHAPAGGTKVLLSSGGKLVRSGATYPTLAISVAESMSRLNLSDNSVTKSLTRDVLSAAGSGVFVGTTPYLFGGTGSTGRSAALRAYNISSNSWATKASGPDSRSSHAAAVQGSNMYIQGGYNGSNMNDLWVYRAGSNSWSQITLSGLPSINRHSMVSCGGCLYIFGGTTNSDSTTPDSNMNNNFYRIS